MIRKISAFIATISATFLLAACGSVPQTTIPSPLTARPAAPLVSTATSGAIFQASTYRPLFEDRRPRMVGDILTISINEKTSAGKQSGSSGSKAGSASIAVPKLFGLPASTVADLSLSSNSSGKFENKGASSASNSFSGTIGATVVEVLQNGNLVVAGEKQIGFDGGSEFIRFYGVVNPDTVTAGNFVSSSQVSDARVEYRTNSNLDTAAFLNMMSRFFQSVLPL